MGQGQARYNSYTLCRRTEAGVGGGPRGSVQHAAQEWGHGMEVIREAALPARCR
jgi:hypothetical protein